jgi:hypothetical protein
MRGDQMKKRKGVIGAVLLVIAVRCGFVLSGDNSAASNIGSFLGIVISSSILGLLFAHLTRDKRN